MFLSQEHRGSLSGFIGAAFGLSGEGKDRVFCLDEGLVFEAGDEVGDRDAEVRVAEESAVVIVGLNAQGAIALLGQRGLEQLPGDYQIPSTRKRNRRGATSHVDS